MISSFIHFSTQYEVVPLPIQLKTLFRLPSNFALQHLPYWYQISTVHSHQGSVWICTYTRLPKDGPSELRPSDLCLFCNSCFEIEAVIQCVQNRYTSNYHPPQNGRIYRTSKANESASASTLWKKNEDWYNW